MMRGNPETKSQNLRQQQLFFPKMLSTPGLLKTIRHNFLGFKDTGTSQQKDQHDRLFEIQLGDVQPQVSASTSI